MFPRDPLPSAADPCTWLWMRCGPGKERDEFHGTKKRMRMRLSAHEGRGKENTYERGMWLITKENERFITLGRRERGWKEGKRGYCRLKTTCSS